MNEDTMLNLKIRGFYEIECAMGDKYLCQVCSKTVHGDKMHSYLVQWPNTEFDSIHPFGIYLWDYGWANKGRDYVSFSLNPIVKCRELTEEESIDLIWQFIKAGQEKAIKSLAK